MDTERETIAEIISDSAIPFPEIKFEPTVEFNVASADQISKTFMEEVGRVRQQAEQMLEWAVMEIIHWRDKCHELEVENMILQGDFEHERDLNVRELNFKRRER